jgi:hypothetical protein
MQCFFDLRIRDGKKSGSGINIPDHISKSFGTIFWLKNTEILFCGFGTRDEKIGIWNKQPGSATLAP